MDKYYYYSTHLKIHHIIRPFWYRVVSVTCDFHPCDHDEYLNVVSR